MDLHGRAEAAVEVRRRRCEPSASRSGSAASAACRCPRDPRQPRPSRRRRRRWRRLACARRTSAPCLPRPVHRLQSHQTLQQTNIISIYRKNTHICKYMLKYAEICNLCQNICTLYALWAAKICNVYMQNMQKYAIYMQYICKYIDSICNNVIF